jgi:photosynthetic reaction center cytochrome c subunit
MITMRRAALAGLAACVAVSGCRNGETRSVQLGYRGLAKEINYSPDGLAISAAQNRAPAPLPPAGPAPAGPVPWKNVQVLTDINAAEFTRTMVAITQWVAPTTGPRAGCAYCHDVTNFASDTIYAKVVARRMFQMVRHVNNDYKAHVAGTGVTCYTCHRGQPYPNGLWWYTDENQYLRHYLDRSDIRVQTHSPYPEPDVNRSSIKQTNYTYALMINQSRALGVNCTFCHNSRQWSSWEQSSPYRIVAWHGLEMVRDLNMNYLTPLHTVFPDSAKGPLGDSPKLQCITCHNGVYKPLYGAKMVKDYPALWGASSWDTTSATEPMSDHPYEAPPPLPAPR